MLENSLNSVDRERLVGYEIDHEKRHDKSTSRERGSKWASVREGNPKGLFAFLHRSVLHKLFELQ